MFRKPAKGEYLDLLLRSPRTVFAVRDVALLWKEERGRLVTARLNKYVKSGKLIRIRRGIYAKDENYDRFGLATKIYIPSYISFETVLTRTGINFQHYSSIFVASYVTREIEISGQKISFIRVKKEVLNNPFGIDNVGGYSIASKERAFLDRLYVSKDYHFDNLDGLDWEKVFDILPLYKNKKIEKKVQEYRKDTKR
ncbi:MAG: type IV toxin-antitoxin system AbiEi family antitoxin domain-containing protein [Patescibacteria group bacterium]